MDEFFRPPLDHPEQQLNKNCDWLLWQDVGRHRLSVIMKKTTFFIAGERRFSFCIEKAIALDKRYKLRVTVASCRHGGMIVTFDQLDFFNALRQFAILKQRVHQHAGRNPAELGRLADDSGKAPDPQSISYANRKIKIYAFASRARDKACATVVTLQEASA